MCESLIMNNIVIQNGLTITRMPKKESQDFAKNIIGKSVYV